METIKLLPQISREKLMKLFDDGTLRQGELDHKSVLTLQALSEPLQVCKASLSEYTIVADKSDRAPRNGAIIPNQFPFQGWFLS